ncbi:MAG: multicopper oxidase family protein, partial [Nocardioides sp.]
YNGQVPGPTFRIARGRPSVVRMCNHLPAVHPVLDYTPWTSVHLHGSASLPQYDGYASDLTNPDQWKDYRYPNNQQARTLWYHDHGVHHTAQNVYMGLAGQYHISDAQEQSLKLPQGEYDVPLIISDMMFKTDGSLLFNTRADDGLFGDVIAVNGRPWPLMKVARRKYRFRILNGSISRSYQLYLSNGAPLPVIATDGGLMPARRNVTTLRHGVAERYEVVIDFARYAPGERIELLNRSPRNSVNYTHTDKVMAFEVTGDAFETRNNRLPTSLYPGSPAMQWSESDAVVTRRFDFGRSGGQWTINETTWEDVVASNFKMVLASPLTDTLEIWELRNLSGGWHHPAHIHFVDFRILTRNGRPPRPQEQGPKDVVYLGENETVRVLVGFHGGRGRYMMHCHNLVHEDHDMMAQFEIIDPLNTAFDPFSDPCRTGPETEL